MQRLFVGLFVLLAACAPRGGLTLYPQAAETVTPRAIYLATTRGTDGPVEAGVQMGRSRSASVRYARFDITVPPGHQPGTISFPKPGRAPDPAQDFLVTDRALFPGAAPFRQDLSRALAANGGDAVVFVHGYNDTMAEGLYRLAQLGHDLKLPGVLVHYSWPSRGQAFGYAYDRDSALFARDGFEEALDQLAAAGAKRITLVAHSMGGALTMETLRQMAIAGDRGVINRIAGVVLISPDLDVDVFRAQARRIGTLPQPFLIFTSQRDRALALAAKLSGETNRLGNLQDLSRVADLKVTLVEVGAYSTGDGHFTPGSSPALIALLAQVSDLDRALARDQAGRTGLLPGVVLTLQQATQVVMTP
jgi:esterase/lipase superfamily enzyme